MTTNDEKPWFSRLYSSLGRLLTFFPASKRPTMLKTITNHGKAIKTGSKPGARGALGTPRGRPGLKVPGNPPFKSPALGLLVPGYPHTLPEEVILQPQIETNVKSISTSIRLLHPHHVRFHLTK